MISVVIQTSPTSLIRGRLDGQCPGRRAAKQAAGAVATVQSSSIGTLIRGKQGGLGKSCQGFDNPFHRLLPSRVVSIGGSSGPVFVLGQIVQRADRWLIHAEPAGSDYLYWLEGRTSPPLQAQDNRDPYELQWLRVLPPVQLAAADAFSVSKAARGRTIQSIALSFLCGLVVGGLPADNKPVVAVAGFQADDAIAGTAGE
jgi:hypothetical protein